MSRVGKHRRSKVQMKFYVDRNVKAIIGLTACHTGKTMTDLLIHGVMGIAMGAGIVDSNFNVTEKFRNELEVYRRMVEDQESDK